MTYLDIGDVSFIQQQSADQLMGYSDDVTHSVNSIEYYFPMEQSPSWEANWFCS